MMLKTDNRSVRCEASRRYAVAVPHHNRADRLKVTARTNDPNRVHAEVRRLARLNADAVYVFLLVDGSLALSYTRAELAGMIR